MIDWVDVQCRSWANHKRWLMYGEHGWPPISTLGRLMIEGPGAGDGSFIQRLPVRDDPEAYRTITIALQRMAETQQMEKPRAIVEAHYVFGGKAKEKAPKLGVSLPSYWAMLHAAHAFILACDVPRGEESSRRISSCA